MEGLKLKVEKKLEDESIENLTSEKLNQFLEFSLKYE